MSVLLDNLLEEMNRLGAGRGEDNIGMSDPYWGAKKNYQQALSAANGVHVPVKANLGVDEASAKKVEVAKAAQSHIENVVTTETDKAKAQADLIVAEADLKAAEDKLKKEKEPVPEAKPATESEVEGKRAAVVAAKKKLDEAAKVKVEVPVIEEKKLEEKKK